MDITHVPAGRIPVAPPLIEVSRADDGFMLCLLLEPRRSSLLGPFPSAYGAEKTGIEMASARGVDKLTVVCGWL